LTAKSEFGLKISKFFDENSLKFNNRSWLWYFI